MKTPFVIPVKLVPMKTGNGNPQPRSLDSHFRGSDDGGVRPPFSSPLMRPGKAIVIPKGAQRSEESKIEPDKDRNQAAPVRDITLTPTISRQGEGAWTPALAGETLTTGH